MFFALKECQQKNVNNKKPKKRQEEITETGKHKHVAAADPLAIFFHKLWAGKYISRQQAAAVGTQDPSSYYAYLPGSASSTCVLRKSKSLCLCICMFQPPLNPLLHLNSELNLNKVKLWHNELAARQQQSQVRIMKGLKVKRSSLCQRERVTNLISSVFYF